MAIIYLSYYVTWIFSFFRQVPEALQDEGQYIVEETKTESKLETLRRTIGEGFDNAMDSIPKLIPKVKEAFVTMETQMSDPDTIDRLANDAAQQVNVNQEVATSSEWRSVERALTSRTIALTSFSIGLQASARGGSLLLGNVKYFFFKILLKEYLYEQTTKIV